MRCLKVFLWKYGVIANEQERPYHADQYIDQRLGLSLAYTALLFVAAAHVICRWTCTDAFPVIRGGLVLGLSGLTLRNWSYLNQPESPFPPYVATYPAIVFFGCLFVIHLTLQKLSAGQLWMAPYLVAAPCFIIGYGPMDVIGKWKW